MNSYVLSHHDHGLARPQGDERAGATAASAVVTIQARTRASSCQASYLPLRPPCPATISVLSRNGPPRLAACSLAIHFAGSRYSTRVSFRLVTARIGGEARPGAVPAGGGRSLDA